MNQIADEISVPTDHVDLKTSTAIAKSYEKQKVMNGTERQDLVDNKDKIIRGTSQIRRLSQRHRIKVELVEQINDAALKVELAEHALKRTKFFLDKTRLMSCNEGRRRPLVKNGAWVTKGERVLKVQKWL